MILVECHLTMMGSLANGIGWSRNSLYDISPGSITKLKIHLVLNVYVTQVTIWVDDSSSAHLL